MIKKIWNWLKDSHRWQHLVLGMAVGMLADGWYCAALVGTGVAGALEFKDKQWGGKPDWIDFALTVTGVMLGYTLRWLICRWIF
jgi:hypothetical protein